MELTSDEQAAFEAATHCYICKKPFTENDKKVRDHDHAKPPGQNYRGAAHNSCNLNYHSNKEIPIFFHNGKNYDNHFLMQAMIDMEEKPKIIPTNTERYMSLTIKNLVTFVDSNLHLTSVPRQVGQKSQGRQLRLPHNQKCFQRSFLSGDCRWTHRKGCVPLHVLEPSG